MIVALHQPNFLPWLGYLDRMIQADMFILLDHVQFERRNYQNRTRILLDGTPQWITVPVQQHSQLETIVDKRIDNSSLSDTRNWASNQAKTLRHAYRHAPHLNDTIVPLRRILETRFDRLVDLNHMLLLFLREAFSIHTPLIKSSALNVSGAKSDLVLNLCQAAGADAYLAGRGGSREYLDVAAFKRAGIEVIWQDFDHPRYQQCGSGDFVSGLSALDMLMNLGPQSRKALNNRSAAMPVPASPHLTRSGLKEQTQTSNPRSFAATPSSPVLLESQPA